MNAPSQVAEPQSRSASARGQGDLPAALSLKDPAVPYEDSNSGKMRSSLEEANVREGPAQIESHIVSDKEEEVESCHNDSLGESITAAALSITAQAASLATAVRLSIRGILTRVAASEPACMTKEEADEQGVGQSIETKGRSSSSLRDRVMSRRLSSVKEGTARRDIANDKQVKVLLSKTAVYKNKVITLLACSQIKESCIRK